VLLFYSGNAGRTRKVPSLAEKWLAVAFFSVVRLV
jgi:hypothetical protein